MYRRIASAATQRAATIAVVLFDKTTATPAAYRDIDKRTGGALTAAIKRGEFSAARGNVTTLYPASGGVERLLVVGLGDAGKPPGDALRSAGGRLVRLASAARLDRLAVAADPGLFQKADIDADSAARALGDGFAIANFEFDAFKGSANNGGKDKPAAIDLAVELDATLRKGFDHAIKVGDSMNLARTLAATPPNVANPKYICDFAKSMAKKVGLRCRIIDSKEAKKLGMGGLLAVGGAGSTPPGMVVLEWWGQGAKGSRGQGKDAPLLFVGKAVTFDTGGISLKPADSMDKMKYDKCGGMAVLGAMHAIASLKLPVNVVGIVPAAENMPGQTAYRPGDILTHHNGVTSEIINTDAEGRLILADALAFGTKTYKPAAVVDLATLTGACVVALGSACAGCFCGDADFRGRLFDAADDTGERLWHMPLWDEHRAAIKGTHGDILNAGGREAGACTAAAFLSFFIEPDGAKKMPALPWAHLDIAGVADAKKDTGPFAVGPTGFGVRLLTRLAENR